MIHKPNKNILQSEIKSNQLENHKKLVYHKNHKQKIKFNTANFPLIISIF